MATIIAGHVQLQEQAERIRAALCEAGCAASRVSVFFVNQPGQHDIDPLGGDRANSPGATDAPADLAEGAAAGGLVGAALGLASVPLSGPVGPLLGGLVGAHVGSLLGLVKMHEAGPAGAPAGPPRRPGMLVAVALDGPAPDVVALMRRHGADPIERAEGDIVDGDWIDFDPLSIPALLA